MLFRSTESGNAMGYNNKITTFTTTTTITYSMTTSNAHVRIYLTVVGTAD